MTGLEARLADELRAALRACRDAYATAGEQRQEAWTAHRATGGRDPATRAAHDRAEELATHTSVATAACVVALRLLDRNHRPEETT